MTKFCEIPPISEFYKDGRLLTRLFTPQGKDDQGRSLNAFWRDHTSGKVHFVHVEDEAIVSVEKPDATDSRLLDLPAANNMLH